jgi:hypothetical protein
MSEMKSRCANHMHALSHGSFDDSSSVSVNGHNDSGGDTICKVVPVSTDILSVTDCTSRSSISVLSSPVSDGPTQGSSTNPIKLDENHDSTEELSQVDSIQNVSVSHSVNFQTNNDSSPDLNHIVIPVSSSISSGKMDEHHVLSAQDISQIIAIPLTSSAIYGHSVGISFPISGNAVPLSLPVQVASNMLPMSCSLLPVSSSVASIHPASVPVSETSGQLVTTAGSVESYHTSVPSVSPNAAGTVVQQHSHLSTDISGLVTVTSSTASPVSSASTMTSVTSASTTGVSGMYVQ